MITVRFQYLTGIKRSLFRNARLAGSWNGWRDLPMQEATGEDGCPAFEATVVFDDAMAGREVRWGVRHDGPSGANQWGIATEDPFPHPVRTERIFTLPPAGGHDTAQYRLTVSRFLGAQKLYEDGREHIRFAVWAPDAQAVDVVFGKKDNGYIYDDGRGIDPSRPVIALHGIGGGIWASVPQPDFQS
jgi:1,4-alpha-glucan branching enzyme